MFKQLTQSDKATAMGWIRGQLTTMNHLITSDVSPSVQKHTTDSSTTMNPDQSHLIHSSDIHISHKPVSITQELSNTTEQTDEKPSILSYLPLNFSDLTGLNAATFKVPDSSLLERTQESHQDLNTPEPFVILACPVDVSPSRNVPMIQGKYDNDNSEVINILQSACDKTKPDILDDKGTTCTFEISGILCSFV